jgi:hypothetical protein
MTEAPRMDSARETELVAKPEFGMTPISTPAKVRRATVGMVSDTGKVKNRESGVAMRISVAPLSLPRRP